MKQQQQSLRAGQPCAVREMICRFLGVVRAWMTCKVVWWLPFVRLPPSIEVGKGTSAWVCCSAAVAACCRKLMTWLWKLRCGALQGCCCCCASSCQVQYRAVKCCCVVLLAACDSVESCCGWKHGQMQEGANPVFHTLHAQHPQWLQG